MGSDTFTLHLDGFEQTARLAQAVANALRGGELLALQGDLGAGKTSFTRELTRALGCARLANSPTFALFQRYRGGRLPVLHGDLYRLGAPQELEDLGWDELLCEFSSGLVVVEWANRFPHLLPSDRLLMDWQLGAGEQERQVRLTAYGQGAGRLLSAVRAVEGWS